MLSEQDPTLRKKVSFFLWRTTYSDNSTKKSDPRPHVVIIGAGFGGIQAAKRLADAQVQVTVIDRTKPSSFQPLLCQVCNSNALTG